MDPMAAMMLGALALLVCLRRRRTDAPPADAERREAEDRAFLHFENWGDGL